MPQALTTIPDNCPFIELQSVDSTNNYARQLINAGDQPYRQDSNLHGTAIFAHEQVAGKGQRGKVWASEKGANIALSILIHPRGLPLNNPFLLSACAAVAAHRFFNKYGGDDTKIKWPNDIYWQDRKAGGILIETGIGEWRIQNRDDVTESNPILKWAIVGMGFNINQTEFDASLPNPVSLKQITGKSHDPMFLAKELHQIFCTVYNDLATDGFEKIYQQYNQFLYKKDEMVKLKKDNRVFEALIKEVNRSGQLVTQHAFEECFDFGGVEWVVKK